MADATSLTPFNPSLSEILLSSKNVEPYNPKGQENAETFSFTFYMNTFEPPHAKTNKMTVRVAKTQISLGIRPVWSEFAVRSMGS